MNAFDRACDALASLPIFTMLVGCAIAATVLLVAFLETPGV